MHKREYVASKEKSKLLIGKARVDTGTDDLAYMMACHWEFAARAELEIPLLRLYYARLCELGVANYAWSDSLCDYQASINRCLFFLENAWSVNQWEFECNRIERGLLAFREFNGANNWPEPFII